MQLTKNHIIYILLLLVVAIQLQQYFTWGHLWDFDQTLHHEVLSIALIAGAITIYLVGKKKVKV
jgi:hypothetical protein